MRSPLKCGAGSTGLAVKGNKRRAEDVLRLEIEKMRLSQGRNLTGGDQLFLPFMGQWLNEVESYFLYSAKRDMADSIESALAGKPGPTVR